jgi:hypothetical protein
VCRWLLLFFAVIVSSFHCLVWVFHLFGLWVLVEGFKGVGIGVPSSIIVDGFFLCLSSAVLNLCEPILWFLLSFRLGRSV